MACCCAPSFKIPTFNLICDVYTNPFFPGPPPPAKRLSLSCAWKNLMGGHPLGGHVGGAVLDPSAGFLFMPKLSDLRDGNTTTGADSIELPAGSGRWYTCDVVDDANKGFPNEFRWAKLSKFGTWTTPIP